MLIHEGGHFFFARLFKVKVNEFALGMGPVIFKKEHKGTLYSVRIFPIGGFVKMEGEDETSEDEGAFFRKKIYQRILIITAGAIMNILLGFFILVGLSSMGNGFTTNVVDTPSKGNTVLQAGDTVLQIDNHNVFSNLDIPFLLMRVKGESTQMKILRNNQVINIPDYKYSTDNGIKYIGFTPKTEEKNILTVLSNSSKLTVTIVRMVWLSVLDLVTGAVGIEQASGPVGMTKAVGQAASSGLPSLFTLVAFITINLGVFNLLPLPALDGGRLIFLILEAVRGKPIKAEYEGYVHFAGFVLLMLLMLFVTFNDIKNLFVK